MDSDTIDSYTIHMKMSQLSAESGVTVASIKFYLREGLLAAGERTSANQASYGDAHVQRLRLIRALIEVGGLSVATAREVIAAVDAPDLPLSWIFGIAQLAISDADLYLPVAPESAGRRQVDDAIARAGWMVTPENPGRAGAARVLDTYAQLGQKHLNEISPQYIEAAELIAQADLAAVARNTDIGDMAQTVVVGTILGDALLASLRRIAQEHVSYQLFPPIPRSEA
jgi:DNA-binding transcriptional MerR regulator